MKLKVAVHVSYDVLIEAESAKDAHLQIAKGMIEQGIELVADCQECDGEGTREDGSQCACYGEFANERKLSIFDLSQACCKIFDETLSPKGAP